MVLLVCLCHYFAVRRFGCCDHLQTFAIVLAVAGLIGGGTQLCVYASQSLPGALLYLGATLLMAGLFGGWRGRLLAACGPREMIPADGCCHGSDTSDNATPE